MLRKCVAMATIDIVQQIKIGFVNTQDTFDVLIYRFCFHNFFASVFFNFKTFENQTQIQI